MKTASYSPMTLLIDASIMAAFGSLVMVVSNVGTMSSPAPAEDVTLVENELAEIGPVEVGLAELTTVAGLACPDPGAGCQSLVTVKLAMLPPDSIRRNSSGSTIVWKDANRRRRTGYFAANR